MYLVHNKWPDGAFLQLLFLPFVPSPAHKFLDTDGRGRNYWISQISD